MANASSPNGQYIFGGDTSSSIYCFGRGGQAAVGSWGRAAVGAIDAITTTSACTS